MNRCSEEVPRCLVYENAICWNYYYATKDQLIVRCKVCTKIKKNRGGVSPKVGFTWKTCGEEKKWKRLQAWFAYPFWNTKDSFLGLSNSPFFSFFLWFILDFPFSFLMSNEIVLLQILYKHLKYLIFSLIEVEIIKFNQNGPCSINGPKFLEISLFETFYIAIGHLVFVIFIHLTYINTWSVFGKNLGPKKKHFLCVLELFFLKKQSPRYFSKIW